MTLCTLTEGSDVEDRSLPWLMKQQDRLKSRRISALLQEFSAVITAVVMVTAATTYILTT